MFSPQVDLAVVTALEAHGLATRKGGTTYELSHVVAVAMIVADHGFAHEAVVAALLHDTLETTSLDPEIIRRRFGDTVLAIVEDLTEPDTDEPWEDRKRAYIERLGRSPHDAARAVASADKMHNMWTMMDGLRRWGADYWERAGSRADRMLWYQPAVFAMLRGAWRHPIVDRHGEVLEEFLELTRGAAHAPTRPR